MAGKTLIATKRAIDLAFTIGMGTDRNEIAKAVQVSVKYYDDLLEVMAVWAWTLASTGAQACPCVISNALFDKATLLVNGRTGFAPLTQGGTAQLEVVLQRVEVAVRVQGWNRARYGLPTGAAHRPDRDLRVRPQ